MLQKYKDKREEGFTIIEVLIVLAIAGLIILIVFLAVPALQRNNRNTQRKSDAARVISAMTECITNNRGDRTSCFTPTVGGYADPSKNLQLTTIKLAGTAPVSTDGMLVHPGEVCNDDGSGTVSTGTTKLLAITYQIETSGAPATRCVDVS